MELAEDLVQRQVDLVQVVGRIWGLLDSFLTLDLCWLFGFELEIIIYHPGPALTVSRHLCVRFHSVKHRRITHGMNGKVGVVHA